ncbi:hypothetical protein L7F22_068523 [Adiantum nelumboides]|nr:hypothetical protein [Adiantum nelumboides]
MATLKSPFNEKVYLDLPQSQRFRERNERNDIPSLPTFKVNVSVHQGGKLNERFCSMDDDEFLSSLSPDQRRWYEQRYHSGAPSRRFAPSTFPSILEHLLCSEGLVSTKRYTHSSRHSRSSGGKDDCCGDAATDASTPLRSRRGSLPSSSLPVFTPTMALPSTPRFVGYTPLATPPSVTPVDTPHFGAQTLVETPVDRTPIKTPLDTPLETPVETPRFTRHRHEGLQYSIDLSGSIILDEDDKKVILQMRGLCSQVFRHYILNTWSELPSELKDRVINMLHDEFPVSSRNERFNEDPMKWSMTGRDPTPYEREYVGRKGLNALMDIFTSCGGMNPTDTPLGRDETSN